MSPLNTLDSKSSSVSNYTNSPSNQARNNITRSLIPNIPLKVDKLPSSFGGKVSMMGSLDSLLKKYPGDTFCTEETSSREFGDVDLNRKSLLYEKTKISDSECYEKQPVSPSITQSSKPAFSDQKQIKVATIQYRHIIIPPSKCEHKYSNFKLIFIQKDRTFVLSCSVDDSPNSAVLFVSFSKVLRLQFIRDESLSSSDWYIDFVLFPGTEINLKPFMPINSSSNFNDTFINTFSEFSTLRVNLDYSCGASCTILENILLNISKDRNAFYFANEKDAYGEFELNKRISSPDRSYNSKLSLTKSLYNSSKSSPRMVPSLESLSASDSVKIKSRRQAFIDGNDQIYTSKSSPDVFDSKRQSKRIKTALTTPPKKQLKESDFAYVDPEFESECIK